MPVILRLVQPVVGAAAAEQVITTPPWVVSCAPEPKSRNHSHPASSRTASTRRSDVGVRSDTTPEFVEVPLPSSIVMFGRSAPSVCSEIVWYECEARYTLCIALYVVSNVLRVAPDPRAVGAFGAFAAVPATVAGPPARTPVRGPSVGDVAGGPPPEIVEDGGPAIVGVEGPTNVGLASRELVAHHVMAIAAATASTTPNTISRERPRRRRTSCDGVAFGVAAGDSTGASGGVDWVAAAPRLCARTVRQQVVDHRHHDGARWFRCSGRLVAVAAEIRLAQLLAWLHEHAVGLGTEHVAMVHRGPRAHAAVRGPPRSSPPSAALRRGVWAAGT